MFNSGSTIGNAVPTFPPRRVRAKIIRYCIGAIAAASIVYAEQDRISLVREREARERRVAERVAKSSDFLANCHSPENRETSRPNVGASVNGPLPETERAELGNAIRRYIRERGSRIPDLRTAETWFE